MTCVRAREFLERRKARVLTETSAARDRQGRSEALALAASAKRLVAAKGSSLVELDLTRRPPAAEILALMLGPTGNLRAPTLRIGSTLYVGFPKGGFADFA